MIPAHHSVRNFVVRELPRNGGLALTTCQIANALELPAALVANILDDLEKGLFFLVRDTHGDVSWAFPVTCDRTPHRLKFSTGESIFGAWAEDSFTTPFVQGRLRNESLEVEITTACAHCGVPIHITVNEHFEWRVQEPGADPHLFLPTIDWPRFRAPNIIGDYWTNSVFFWSEEHIRIPVPGQVLRLSEAAKIIEPAQAKLFGFGA